MADILTPFSFRWRGRRADDVINSGGLKFFPDELEALYRPYMGTLEYCVYSPGPMPSGVKLSLLPLSGAMCMMICRGVLRAGVADHRRLPKHIRV